MLQWVKLTKFLIELGFTGMFFFFQMFQKKKKDDEI